MLNYLTFTTTTEILCFLIAFVCLRKDKVWIWKYFNLFLLITCLAELTGVYLKRHHQMQNAWVYNILMVFEISFVSLMLLRIFSTYVKAKAFILCSIILFALLFGYELFSHGIFVYNNLTYTVMSVIIVTYALFYYYGLINSDNDVRVGFSAEFWWVTGCLFYYFGETACDLFYDKLQAVYVTPLHTLTYYIYALLNILLYGCWSYSFICRRWLEKRLETQ
jgi:hypothetical protein